MKEMRKDLCRARGHEEKERNCEHCGKYVGGPEGTIGSIWGVKTSWE